MSNTPEGKRFATDFVRIDRVKANDKILIYDSADGTVKYAQPSQINALFEKFLTDSDTAATAAASASASEKAAASSKNDAKNAEDAAEGYALDAQQAAASAQGVLNLSAEGSCNLNERVATLERLIISLLSGETIAEKFVVRDLQIFGTTSLIKWGEGTPVVAPDFVGQRYIDTTSKLVYTAVGNAAVADWVQQ